MLTDVAVKALKSKETRRIVARRAREKCIDARRAIADGISPAIEKQREKRRLNPALLSVVAGIGFEPMTFRS
jgi:hypothetical protein